MTAATSFAVAGELTIVTIGEHKARLMAAIDALPPGGRLRMDLSDCIELDTAGVQLLLLAGRETSSRGGDVDLAGMSAAVTEVLALLGLVDGVPGVAAGSPVDEEAP